jgi:hypothetical protein
MSDYCNCCPTNTEHIRQHYDPGRLVSVEEDPGQVLETCRRCFPSEPCLLTLEDVEAYLAELRQEPSDRPDDVTTERVVTLTPDRKSILRLGSVGITYIGDDGKGCMLDLVERHATLISHGDAPSKAGRYVGTFRGGPIREIHYEFRGKPMWCYVLVSVDIDDWSEECWTTDRRLTAEAASETILAARRRPCR